MIEYARNVIGAVDAAHAEYDPEAPNPWIVPVACPVPDRADGAPNLSGGLVIRVEHGSLANRVLGRNEVEEDFFCNYELDPDRQAAIEAAGMRISGRGERGEARIVELPDHRFFLATLFLPQHNSSPEQPHPLIAAYLQAALAFKEARVAGET